jgi:hypothetical protein
MKLLRNLRPTPSMVIACAALLVALAGTSVAAVSIAIPRNSIGALQLKANSVNSSKVLNGSLLRADFRAGQLPRGATGLQGPAGPQGPQGVQGPTGAQGPSGLASPGYTAETLSQNGNTDTSTQSTSFTNLNNASLNVTVPSGETDKLVVYFSAESACYGGSDVATCLLKINVDGTELSPVAGSDAVFDNNVTTRDPFDAKRNTYRYQHSIVRLSGNLSAGTHQVQVQFAVSDAAVAFNLDDWALVVQRIKVS